MMARLPLITGIFLHCMLLLASPSSRVHFQLHKRGGRPSRHATANLTLLSQLAGAVEARYAQSYLQIAGNQLSRGWTSSDVGSALDKELMQGIGEHGHWCAWGG